MNNHRTKVVLESISKKFQVEWIFKNYSLEKKELGIPLESPEFQMEFDGDCSRWRIELYPGGYNDTSANFVGAFLKLIDTKHENLMVSCEFVLFNSKSKTIRRNGFKSELYKNGKGFGIALLIFRVILLRDISHDHYLRILCNIEVSYYYKLENILPCLPISDLKSSFRSDFNKMRADGYFSDITITVGGSEFKAHKSILAARSSVFFSMFTHKMKEANSGRVEIQDIEPQVFEEFLNYIYVGNAKVEENCFQLLAAANKYDVQDLKTECENLLIKNITKENCFKILVFSDLHSIKKLKEQAMDFIVSRTSLEDKNGIAEINDVSLLKELIEGFMNKNKN